MKICVWTPYLFTVSPFPLQGLPTTLQLLVLMFLLPWIPFLLHDLLEMLNLKHLLP